MGGRIEKVIRVDVLFYNIEYQTSIELLVFNQLTFSS
jgi:hypothetical protein